MLLILFVVNSRGHLSLWPCGNQKTVFVIIIFFPTATLSNLQVNGEVLITVLVCIYFHVIPLFVNRAIIIVTSVKKTDENSDIHLK